MFLQLPLEGQIGRVSEGMEYYLLRVIVKDNDDYLRVQSSFALKTVVKKTELPRE